MKIKKKTKKLFFNNKKIKPKPLNPDLILNAGNENETQSVKNVLQFLYKKEILPEKV